jgi:hypothetical protein
LKTLLYPYKPYSSSARKLAQAMGIRRLRPNSKLNLMKVNVINWGSSNPPDCPWLFNLNASIASDKLATLEALSKNNTPCVPFTTKRTVAFDWLSHGSRVFARHLLNSHSGRGIENLKQEKNKPWTLDEMPVAPLYTLYIQKAAEYRVHMIGREAYFVQQKKKRRGVEVADPYIRSWHNGWIFCSQDIQVPDGLVKLTADTLDALDLDFGAVDIIYGKDGELYVLEVNTAPGLDGETTLDFYSTNLNLMVGAGHA